MIFREIYKSTLEYRLEGWRRDILSMVFKELGIVEDTPKNGLYLDIGCGCGYSVIEAAKKGLTSIGVDLSQVGIRMAQRFAKHELGVRKNLYDFILCDAQSLPFRSNLFTRISSVQVIEHVPDDSRAIDEIARVGRTNCKVLVSTVNSTKGVAPFLWPVYHLHQKRSGHLRGYKQEDLVSLFAMKGFQLENCIYYTHIVKIVQDIFRMIFPGLNWTNARAWRKIDKLDLMFGKVPTGWTFCLLLKKLYQSTSD